MDPERRVMELAWGKVSYLEWRSDAPTRTIVLLHGGGVDSAELSWTGLGSALAEAGHCVIAPDHPGYGHSSVAPWVSTQANLLRYVGEFLERLGSGPHVLGGISLGGGLSLGHVLTHPRRIAGLMLFGSYGLMDRQLTGPFAVPAHLLTCIALRSGVVRAAANATATHRRLMAASLRAIVRNPDRQTPQLLDAVMAEAGRDTVWRSFEQWQRDQYGWTRLRTNYAARLRNVRVPTLLVHGARDTGVPVAAVRRAAREIAEPTLLVVPGAGHWVQRDRPDLVHPAVIDFLAELG